MCKCAACGQWSLFSFGAGTSYDYYLATRMCVCECVFECVCVCVSRRSMSSMFGYSHGGSDKK